MLDWADTIKLRPCEETATALGCWGVLLRTQSSQLMSWVTLNMEENKIPLSTWRDFFGAKMLSVMLACNLSTCEAEAGGSEVKAMSEF